MEPDTIKEISELDTLIFDSVPSIILILDSNLNIIRMNRTAKEEYGKYEKIIGIKRIGNILNCIYSLKHPEGCGRFLNCNACIVRNAVTKSLNGEETRKVKCRVETGVEDSGINKSYSVSSSRLIFNNLPYSLLILEDITELITLHGLIPICASCKSVRNDQGLWDRIENYLESKSDLLFSHSICPECAQKMYPDLTDDKL